MGGSAGAEGAEGVRIQGYVRGLGRAAHRCPAGAPKSRVLGDSEPPRGRRRGEVSVTRLNLFDNDPLGQVRCIIAGSKER